MHGHFQLYEGGLSNLQFLNVKLYGTMMMNEGLRFGPHGGQLLFIVPLHCLFWILGGIGSAFKSHGIIS